MITAAVYGAFLAVRLAMHSFDFSYFVTAGDKFCDVRAVPPNLTVQSNSDGYDGQFYYRLALDPFTSKRTDFGIMLDAPAHRQQRIVYAFIVWALSLGQAKPVPVMMVLVNYVALCAMAWGAAHLAQSAGVHALWGLVIPMWPGLALSLSRNLTEILALSFAVSSLLLVRQERHATAAALLTLSVLTRETCLFFAVAVLMWRAMSRWRGAQPRDGSVLEWAAYSAPLLGYVIWQSVLLLRWREAAAAQSSGALGIPLCAFIKSFRPLIPLQTYHQRLWFVQRLLLIGFAVSVAIAFRSSRARPYEKLAWVLYTFLVVSLGEPVWADEWTSLRVASEFYVTGAVILITSASAVRYPVFGAWALVWAFTLLVRSDIYRIAFFRE